MVSKRGLGDGVKRLGGENNFQRVAKRRVSVAKVHETLGKAPTRVSELGDECVDVHVKSSKSSRVAPTTQIRLLCGQNRAVLRSKSRCAAVKMVKSTAPRLWD
eukprot:2648430-Rhodomonas_salina.1